jgi:hypothetical protein
MPQAADLLSLIKDSQADNLGERLTRVFAGEASPVCLSVASVDEALKGKTIEHRLRMKVLLARTGALAETGRR